MKKLFGFLVCAATAVFVISVLCPKAGDVFKKHIPVMGHEMVNMSEELAQTGLDEVELKPETRDTANKVVYHVSDCAHAGFDFYATGDEAQLDRGMSNVDELVDIGMDHLDDFLENQLTTENLEKITSQDYIQTTINHALPEEAQ